MTDAPTDRLADPRGTYPHLFGVDPRRRLLARAIVGAMAAALVFSFWWTGFFDLDRLIQGASKLGWLFQFMFPPAHNGWLGEFALGLAETLAMAFFGTLLAFVVAVPIGFLGAKNVIPNWLFHFSLRRALDGIRGVDTLIWALIFVNVVGLGPFAGILAIAVADIGVLSKLFAEAIENVDRRPIEGVRATGANRVQGMRFGILPQVMPVILSNTLYFFESNTRSATILGVVGAGGIGQQLSDRIRVNNWDEVMFIVLMILVTVYAIDIVSRNLRLRIIGRQDYRP